MEYLIITILLIPTFLAFYLRKRFPIGKSNPEKFKFKELKLKYKKLGNFADAVSLFLGIVFIAVITGVMVILQSQYLLKKSVGAIYVAGVSWFCFLVAAIFIGAVTFISLEVYIKVLIGRKKADNIEEWQAYCYDSFRNELKLGEVGQRGAEILFIIILMLCVTLLPLGLNNYLIVTKNDMKYHGFLALKEKQLAFKDVKKILYIDRNKNRFGQVQVMDEGAGYTVIMQDGFKFSTANLNINKKNTEESMMNFISKESGVSITKGIHNVDDVSYNISNLLRFRS